MSIDEQALLTEIQSAPQRLDRRMIYADWLEERADPRAEFIHVWHEMESLKPWTERYLDLFRTRQKLRQDIDKDWLRQLGYFHQHSPMFTEIPPDRASKWRLLTLFLELWHRPLANDDVAPSSTIQAAEEHAGRPLPPALAEWYSHSGLADDIWNGPSGDFVVPFSENSNCIADEFQIARGSDEVFSIRISEFETPDPAVYFRDGGLHESGLVITEFAIARAISNVILGSGITPAWRYGRFENLSDRDLLSVGLPMIEMGTEGPVQFFEQEDVIAMEFVYTTALSGLDKNVIATRRLNAASEYDLHQRVDGVWYEPPVQEGPLYG